MGPIGIAAGPSTGPWKKGQSGNPRGKQRGTTHLAEDAGAYPIVARQKDRNGRRRFDRVLERLYDIITAEGGSQNQVNAAALLLAHACGKPVAHIEADYQVTRHVSLPDRRAALLARLASMQALQQPPAPIECEFIEPSSDTTAP